MELSINMLMKKELVLGNCLKGICGFPHFKQKTTKFYSVCVFAVLK